MDGVISRRASARQSARRALNTGANKIERNGAVIPRVGKAAALGKERQDSPAQSGARSGRQGICWPLRGARLSRKDLRSRRAIDTGGKARQSMWSFVEDGARLRGLRVIRVSGQPHEHFSGPLVNADGRRRLGQRRRAPALRPAARGRGSRRARIDGNAVAVEIRRGGKRTRMRQPVAATCSSARRRRGNGQQHTGDPWPHIHGAHLRVGPFVCSITRARRQRDLDRGGLSGRQCDRS